MTHKRFNKAVIVLHVSGPHQEEESKPLLVDCLDGIEQSIYNVLARLRDFYNLRNAHTEERERTYVFILHKELNTAIIVSEVAKN